MNYYHLRTKYYMAFIATMVVLGIGGYWGLRGLKEIGNRFRLMYEGHYAATVLAADLKARISDVRAQLLAMIGEADKERRDRYHARVKELGKEIDGAFNGWSERGLEGETPIGDLKTVWNDFRTTSVSQLIPLIYEGKIAEAKTLALGVQAERYNRMVSLADELVKAGEERASYFMDTSRERFRFIVIFTLGLTLVAVILPGCALYYFMRKDLSIPLTRLTAHAEHMSMGDISHDAKVLTRSEIGDLAIALNKAVGGMRDIIRKTRDLSLKMDKAAGDIERVGGRVDEGSRGQELAIRTITTSVDGLHSRIKEILTNIEQLLRLSEETASSILQMAASIEEVDGNMAALTTTIGETASSIEEIATSLRDVAKGVDDLSSRADETASSLSEIDTAIREVEGFAREGATLAQEVAKEGEAGLKVVKSTHEGMAKIKGSVDSIASVIEELGRGSKEIGKILGVIGDVAEETNLLALNAAILAAQAGEYGKGFGIVADEIRELAERTSASTKEIAEIISGIQLQAERARRSVEEGITRVKEGEGLSMDAMEVLGRILERFKSSHEMSLQVAKATSEQAKGSRQVTEAIEAVTNTIHQIARAVGEQSLGSQQIVKAVERMRELSTHIKKATSEQTSGSKVIAGNTEKVLNSIHTISNATVEQERHTQEILTLAQENIRLIDESLKGVGELKEVVAALKKEVTTLGEELGRFKLE